MGQPQTMMAGPPVFMPYPYRVRQPDRIEMIVNDTAKFENPDIRRVKLLCVAEFVQAVLVLARRRRGGNVVGHAISLGGTSTYGWKRSIE